MTTVSIGRAPTGDAHMTRKASTSCLYGAIPAPSGRGKQRVVARTTALLAFALSPSRASQFLRTASETEPASPMQKYSNRRCADSTGAASAVGKRLQPPWNSPDGLKANVHRSTFRHDDTGKYRTGGLRRGTQQPLYVVLFLDWLDVMRRGPKGGICCTSKAKRFLSFGETSTTKGKQGIFLDVVPRKHVVVRTVYCMSKRWKPWPLDSCLHVPGGATLALFVAAPMGYLRWAVGI